MLCAYSRFAGEQTGTKVRSLAEVTPPATEIKTPGSLACERAAWQTGEVIHL